MENNEHSILRDIPAGGKTGKYHSAIITTYALDLVHFDNQLLHLLHNKHICSINIFADTNQFDKTMDFINPAYISNLGKDYTVTPLKSSGAFHPKIYFFVGDEAVLVVFGSGNLTVPGHGKNHEVFTGFMIDNADSSHRPLIEETWQYLCDIADRGDNFVNQRIKTVIPNYCAFLNSPFTERRHSLHQVREDLYAALVYNDSHSGILKQISELVPLDKVREITVVSPFFDQNGKPLMTLLGLCPDSTINVFIDNECSMPPDRMPQTDRVIFYNFNETGRGKKKINNYSRGLHAKLIHFKTSDSEYCYIGSANATNEGLGTIYKRGINDEFGVLYQSPSFDFLTHLGLNNKVRIDRPQKIIGLTSDNSSCIKYNIRIISVYYESDKLHVVSDRKCPDDFRFVIDNGVDRSCYCLIEPLPKEDGAMIYTVELNLDSAQYVCYMIDADNRQVSNRSFINRPEILARTEPSKITRNINELISKIANDNYFDADILGILSEVMKDIVDSDSPTNVIDKLNSTPTGQDSKEKEYSLPDIKYNPEYDNDNETINEICNIDRTSRLINCVENTIKKRKQMIDDDLYDEEETGAAEYSNKRNTSINPSITLSTKHINNFVDQSKSLLRTYCRMLSTRRRQAKLTGNYNITKDDLNYLSLTLFAVMEICCLNKRRYKFENSSSNISEKSLFDGLELVMSRHALDALKQFVEFCNTMTKPSKIDDSYSNIAQRTMKYVILYGTLFMRHAYDVSLNSYENRIKDAIKQLVSIWGLPSMDYLRLELEPLTSDSEYDVFRLSHIEEFINSLG